MSEQNPRKSNPSPAPFNLAVLLIGIALVALVVGLFSFGAFSNRSAIKQTQVVESPTSETVEAPTDVSTPDVIATLVVTETAALEFSPTPSETVVEPTSSTSTQEPLETLPAETPTSVDDSPTELPTLEPTLAPEQTPAQELPTVTPDEENEAIIFESGGALYEQRVDSKGNPITNSRLLISKDVANGRILKIVPSPNGKYIYYIVRRNSDCEDCEFFEIPYIFSSTDGEIIELAYPLPKIFGWHPNGEELVFGDDGGTVGLFNVKRREIRQVVKVQDWLQVPWEPIVYGIAFSPDQKKFVVSFGLTGRDIGHQAWIANADGSDAHLVMENSGPIFEFAWSPDGEDIAFLARGLETIRADGQNRQTVSKNFSVGFGFAPRWSPDSEYLAFEVYEELPPNSVDITDVMQRLFQYHKIHILNVETNTETRLIADEFGGEINPAWSPDSKHVAFLSNRSGPIEVWAASLNGKKLSLLTSDGQVKRAEVSWLDTTGGETP